jgi:cytidylate kinase
MPVITISRGSYSSGRAVAQEVASRLGYTCVSRDIEVETLKAFDIPEDTLSDAIHEAPSILDKVFVRKELYVAYYASVLLKHLQKDNIVYHGLAGHFFVKDVSHVLKVRIITEMEYRAELAMERTSASKREALRTLRRDDKARRRWGRHFFGLDTNDPSLYDLTIQVNRISIDEAASMICKVAELPQFQATDESRQAMDDLALAAKVKAEIIGDDPTADVVAKSGAVHLRVASGSPRKIAALKESVGAITGVEHVVLDADSPSPQF